MSKILLIRHLPTALSFQDKEELLKHFGAEKVWETTKKRNYLFASFNSVEKAKASLGRLHQLEIAHRRLVVEYSFDKEPANVPKTEVEEMSATTKHIKDFIRLLNAWSPSIDFYQPPPPHLKYKYPDITPATAINILYSLFTHKPLYVQTLHLMNKMCLDSPFQEKVEAITHFKKTFKEYFIEHFMPPPPPSETESEMSSDEAVDITATPTPAVVKRKHKLPLPSRKRAAIMPTAPKVKKVVTQAMFEVTPVKESKKISLIVNQDALQKPSKDPEIIGELGTFEKEEQPKLTEVTEIEIEQPCISKQELVQNRMSYRDMKVLPIFKNYHPGQPSMRLYIKNLAKTVTEQDVKRIYKRYIETMSEEEQICFDVRVMQEGRMKGQAFVTFPSVSIAETALTETNGYLLKEKPMVVQFARAANKRTVE